MRFGIIGTGRIALRFVPECLSVPETEITAVYNPHAGSAERFIEKTGGAFRDSRKSGEIPAAFSLLTPFFEKVDAVYIASPHETHFEYIMEALNHGKHVLCEKPMVLKEYEALEAFSLARNKGLVLVEGIKTAYAPGYKRLLDIAKSGIIGKVSYVDACFTKLESPEKRELNDTRFGGSFTELGSYVMLPAFDLIGNDPQRRTFESLKNDKGLDIFSKADLRYRDGMASMTCGLGVKSEGRLLVGGTEGYILAEAPWWKTKHFSVHFEDPSKSVEYDDSFEGDGLRYEISGLMRFASDPDDVELKKAEERSIFFAQMMESFLSGRVL